MLRHFISLPWMLIPAPDQMMYAACKRLGHVPYGAGLQSRWTPGTEREVINMVTHLKIKSDLKEREREVRRLVSVQFNIFFKFCRFIKVTLVQRLCQQWRKTVWPGSTGACGSTTLASRSPAESFLYSH